MSAKWWESKWLVVVINGVFVALVVWGLGEVSKLSTEAALAREAGNRHEQELRSVRESIQDLTILILQEHDHGQPRPYKGAEPEDFKMTQEDLTNLLKEHKLQSRRAGK